MVATNKTILVAGGGTAGHIEPALAVADALKELSNTENLNLHVLALGTPRGLETVLVPKRGYQLLLTDPVPMPRKLNKDLMVLPFKVIKSVMKTKRLFKTNKIDAIIGFGGYASLPAYLATNSKTLLFIHEANATSGLANKVGAKRADLIFSSFKVPGLNSQVVGVPIKKEITNLNRAESKTAAKEKFNLNKDNKVILVIGGSQGAVSINKAVEAVAPKAIEAGISIIHAYGPKNAAPKAVEPANGALYLTLPYLDNIQDAYAAADFVIARSGMMTVAELSTVKLPALYIPLPHGNGEQTLNAKPLVDANASLICKDSELNAEYIENNIFPILKDETKLKTLEDNLKQFSDNNKNSAKNIAKTIVDKL